MDYAIGSGGRKVIIAMRPGENVIDILMEVFESTGLQNAAITSFLGSMTKIAYAYAIADNSRCFGFRYGDTIQLEGLIEIVSGQGMICRNDNNESICHLHAAFCDETGKVMAGHIMPQENICLGTVEVLLEEIDGVNLKRQMDVAVGGAIMTARTIMQKSS